MNINQLIDVVKKKINRNLICESIEIEDKTFLHTKHISYDKNKFHILVKIKSLELKKRSKLELTADSSQLVFLYSPVVFIKGCRKLMAAILP